MNENIKKFLVKLEQSPDLQAQFSQIHDPEEAYKLAASIQDGFTKEEFVSEMKKLYEAQTVDLSDEDIAKVAGGGGSDVINRSPGNGGYSGNIRFKLEGNYHERKHQEIFGESGGVARTSSAIQANPRPR